MTGLVERAKRVFGVTADKTYYADHPDIVGTELIAEIERLLSQLQAAEAEFGNGWVFWNPDSGEEYYNAHPVESGVCEDAESIRRSTTQEDLLWTAMQDNFARAEAAEAEVSKLKAQVETARAALEPFADVGDLIEVETEGFSDTDHLQLLLEESDYLLANLTVGAFRLAFSSLRALSDEVNDGQ